MKIVKANKQKPDAMSNSRSKLQLHAQNNTFQTPLLHLVIKRFEVFF